MNLNQVYVFNNFNNINWVEVLVTGFFTFLAVYIAYYLENRRLRNERKNKFINLLKSLKSELLGNQNQLKIALKNYKKQPISFQKLTVNIQNFPISLEIIKSFMNNSLIYEFLPDYAIREIWNALTETRKAREHQVKQTFYFKIKVEELLDLLEENINKIDNKIKDLY